MSALKQPIGDSANKNMSERDIERRVCAMARANGWLALKWSSPNNRGVPDRIFIKAGVIRLVEFKAPGCKPTPLQAHVHRKLQAHGFDVHVIDSLEAGAALFA